MNSVIDKIQLKIYTLTQKKWGINLTPRWGINLTLDKGQFALKSSSFLLLLCYYINFVVSNHVYQISVRMNGNIAC
jgi:hypothetical protein